MALAGKDNKPMSFAPVTLKRPVNPPQHKTPKLVSDVIRRFLQQKLFINLLYSLSEVKSLKEKKIDGSVSVERVDKLVQEYNNDKLGTLNQLNAMILTGNIDEVLKAFDGADLFQILTSWFTGDTSEIEKMNILNLLCVLVNFSCKDAKSLGPLFTSVVQSLKSANGSSVKKHLLLLLSISTKLADLPNLTDPILTYSHEQTLVVSSSFEEPLSFQFIIPGEIPRAFIEGEKLLQSHTHDKDFMTYLSKGEFSSETHCPEVRNFMVDAGEALSDLAKSLPQIFETNSRALNPKTDFELTIAVEGESEDLLTADKAREKDTIVLCCWSLVYLLIAAFRRSCMMDAELFKRLLVAGGKKSLPALVFRSFASDLKPLLVPSSCEELSAFGPVGKNLNLLAAGLAVALHVTADLVTYWPNLVQTYVTETNVKDVMSVEAIESKILRREAAFLLSHFLRWMGKNNSTIARVMKFIYMNLEQFEMFVKWSTENKTDLVSQLTETKHIEDLQAHAAATKINITVK